MKPEAEINNSVENAPAPVKVVPAELLNRLHLGITALIQYIEAAPGTLLWFADNKTPVRELPDFDYARKAADDLKKQFNRDCSSERSGAC